MEEFAIVMMLMNNETGVLEKELGTYKIGEHNKYVLGLYATSDGENDYLCHLKITTEKDVSDWEFDAVYDYYDGEVFDTIAVSFEEMEGYINPVWEVTFRYDENIGSLENTLNELLEVHAHELNSVYDAIKDKQSEYI